MVHENLRAEGPISPMEDRMPRRPWFCHFHLSILHLACVALLLTGCGLSVQQRAAVQRFSAATADFADIGTSEFVRSRTDVLEMNKLRLQLQDDTLKPSQIDEHFTVERVKVRVDAVGALKEYAELLLVLATSSQEPQLRNAADSLVASLRKLRRHIAPEG